MKHSKKNSQKYYIAQIAVVIILLAILCSFKSHAQYLGVSATTKGAALHAGIVANGIEIAGTYKTPLWSNVTPSVLSLSFGKQILLTNNDIDNWTVTPSIGFASLKYQDFSDYDSRPNGHIIEVSEIKAIYNLEVAKDFYMGRIFISATHCGTTYFSFGLKAFFSTNR